MIARLLLPFVYLALACFLGCEHAATTTQSAASDLEAQNQTASPNTEPPPDQELVNDLSLIVQGKSIKVEDNLLPDPKVSEIIRPYMEQMHASMDEVIGQATADITRDRPEGALGNLVADALRWQANETSEEEIELSLVNNGGIRLPALMEGPITVADIYQLVPFDNRIVVLTLSGKQIEDLLRTLAKKGGEPFSGITYKIVREDREVTDIRIGQQALVPTTVYRLATLDYLASIGREYQILQDAATRVDDTVFLRDAVVAYIRQLENVKPTLDGRVSYED